MFCGQRSFRTGDGAPWEESVGRGSEYCRTRLTRQADVKGTCRPFFHPIRQPFRDTILNRVSDDDGAEMSIFGQRNDHSEESGEPSRLLSPVLGGSFQTRRLLIAVWGRGLQTGRLSHLP